MDPVRTAIMNNRFSAIVEEASAILHRTAHTTFVKLVQDYQCALATPEGEIFAYPNQSGVNVFIGLSLHAAIRRIAAGGIAPGDVFITNDPFGTDGMVTHLMDVTMIRPVFRNDQLIAFAWSFVHASDIGGAVPGSISPAFTEVFQEGLRVPPVRLYRRGELVPEVREIFLANSRIPEELWGDCQAMLAALASMDRRLAGLCDRYGVGIVCSGMQGVIAYAEAKARAAIARIPDGTWRFTDYIEGIGAGELTHVSCTMTVAGDSVELDYTGTDPQIPAAYNMVSGARTHPYVTMALLCYILSMEPEAPRNAGLLRPINSVSPRGTVLNAEFPAAGGARVASATRVYDAILGCLDQALPEGLAAAGPGSVGIIVVTAPDPKTGRNRVTTINPICGGSGARRGLDGVDGIDVRYSALRSVPAETTEIETRMVVRAYGNLPDSQAPGRWRSGAAIRIDLENRGHEATMVVRGLNRYELQPWGIRGGAPGRRCEVTLNPDTPEEKAVGKINVLKMQRGDVVRIVTPSGGGFGDPLERDAALVALDVRSGLMTPAHAEAVYGVSLDDAGVPDVRGQTVRRDASTPPAPADAFSLGAARLAYDRIWPPEVRSDLARRVLEAPASIRQPLLAAVRDTLTQRGEPVTNRALEAVLQDARRSLADS